MSRKTYEPAPVGSFISIKNPETIVWARQKVSPGSILRVIEHPDDNGLFFCRVHEDQQLVVLKYGVSMFDYIKEPDVITTEFV